YVLLATNTYQLTSTGQPIVATKLPTLQCPSDPGFGGGISIHGLSHMNYAGNMGWDGTIAVHTGPRVRSSASVGTRLDDFKDGTSNTIVLAETSAIRN
ncbi:MAG UNVERIFIED_CONTAM: DUF1559 domain-containing protein, partial [Microcystis novacekii LVE1205-3]